MGPKGASGAKNNKGHGIAGNTKGHLYTAGEFYKTATFGATKLIVEAKSDAFVWELVP